MRVDRQSQEGVSEIYAELASFKASIVIYMWGSTSGGSRVKIHVKMRRVVEGWSGGGRRRPAGTVCSDRGHSFWPPPMLRGTKEQKSQTAFGVTQNSYIRT